MILSSERNRPRRSYAYVVLPLGSVIDARRPRPYLPLVASSWVRVIDSVGVPARFAAADMMRFAASKVRVVVAAFASVVEMRFPAGSYAYDVVPLTGLSCWCRRPKSSNA